MKLEELGDLRMADLYRMLFSSARIHARLLFLAGLAILLAAAWMLFWNYGYEARVFVRVGYSQVTEQGEPLPIDTTSNFLAEILGGDAIPDVELTARHLAHSRENRIFLANTIEVKAKGPRPEAAGEAIDAALARLERRYEPVAASRRQSLQSDIAGKTQEIDLLAEQLANHTQLNEGRIAWWQERAEALETGEAAKPVPEPGELQYARDLLAQIDADRKSLRAEIERATAELDHLQAIANLVSPFTSTRLPVISARPPFSTRAVQALLGAVFVFALLLIGLTFLDALTDRIALAPRKAD